jgi:hypothetical protein
MIGEGEQHAPMDHAPAVAVVAGGAKATGICLPLPLLIKGPYQAFKSIAFISWFKPGWYVHTHPQLLSRNNKTAPIV